MSRHIDAVTSLIDQVLDVGQQHTDEASYGDDHGPGRCWRGPAPADDDSTSGLCAGCRSFLLEDSDDDPAERGRGVRPGGDLLALSGGSRWTVRTALNDGSGAEVSTVFLVIDHNHGFGLDDPGIWYETMVFGGSLDGHQWRYSTRADAEAGHQRVCAMDHTGEPADEAVF